MLVAVAISFASHEHFLKVIKKTSDIVSLFRNRSVVRELLTRKIAAVGVGFPGNSTEFHHCIEIKWN